MTHWRIAAVVTWAYAAGFGLSTIPVALYLRRRGQLPEFFDLFEMFGGPWSARLAQRTFIMLLLTFLVVNVVTAWAAWLVWNGSKPGAVLSLALLPVEGVFWIGFALPIPWLLGALRLVLLVLGWRSVT